MKESAHLASVCLEAVRLLHHGSYELLAAQYGYALAFERPVHEAIWQDLTTSLEELGANKMSLEPYAPRIEVTLLAENLAGISAVIECVVATDAGSNLLVEFVVTSQWVSLEQISSAA